jgi:hypothetical protein
MIVGRVSLEAAPPGARHDHAEMVLILVNSRKQLRWKGIAGASRDGPALS